MSVSPPGKQAFSSLGVFHAAISSSSMGVTPRERKGRRRCRLLHQKNTAPAIRATPTTENTVLRAMTSVLLLAVSEPSVLDVPELCEKSVVVGIPAEVAISVGIVSVNKTSLDVCQSSAVEG